MSSKFLVYDVYFLEMCRVFQETSSVCMFKIVLIFILILLRSMIGAFSFHLTNAIAYGPRRFISAFTRAFQ
jgi:hypothetical protein